MKAAGEQNNNGARSGMFGTTFADEQNEAKRQSGEILDLPKLFYFIPSLSQHEIAVVAHSSNLACNILRTVNYP